MAIIQLPFRPGGVRVLNKVLYGEAPPGGSNPYPLYTTFYQHDSLSYHNLRPFFISQGQAKTIEFLIIATFLPGFQSS